MNYTFGAGSQKKLFTVDPKLVEVAEYALRYGIIDFTIVEGARSKEKQDQMYKIGRSKLKWPQSKHNQKMAGDKAAAFDAAPYINDTISWNKMHCLVLAGVILAAASELGVRLRWGGNWDMDGEPITDQDFQDLVHYELY